MTKDKNETLFWTLREEYEKKFGETFVLPEPSYLGFEDGVKIMRDCIKNGKPYEYPELPEGCIA